jgi:serine/threonine protein kinase
MTDSDAASVAKHIIKVKLMTEAQMKEIWETEETGNDPNQLLRVLERKGYLTSWQSQRVLAGESDGYFLGGYRLLYRVGSGSFGRVYRADDPRSGEVVAVKVLRRRWSEDERTLRLFEKEGKVGLSLHHPNIVSILTVAQDPQSKQHYIAMEFVEGGNLRDILAKSRTRLKPTEALRLLEDAVTGLVYAYALGVTHRDIKASNILISSQGVAKLVDFGLAGIYREQEAGKNKMYRTVDYAGLERATNVKPGDVRSDIFFLGCVFYEMLTGKPPLELSKSERARMQRQRFQNMATLRPGDVDAPPAVFHLAHTMMALDPRRRFQTPSQLLEAIRKTRREAGDAPQQTAGEAKERTIFVVEKNTKLQDALRAKFKELGYRVLLSGDPTKALNRYQEQPFDGLVLRAGDNDVGSVVTFERIMIEAASRKEKLAGILLLAEGHADMAQEVRARSGVTIMVRPVTFSQIVDKVLELVPLAPEPSARRDGAAKKG